MQTPTKKCFDIAVDSPPRLVRLDRQRGSQCLNNDGLLIKERLGSEAVELVRVHDRNVAENLSEAHEEAYVEPQTAWQQRACFRQTSTWKAASL